MKVSGAEGGCSEGGRREGAEQERACCPLRLAPRLRHCYLRQRLSPAPRRPAPSRSQAALAAETREEALALEAAVGSEERARGHPAAGECEPDGGGRGDRRSGASGPRHSPAPEGQGGGSARTGAAAPSLGCLQASTERLGRFALPPHPPE